MGHSFGNYLHTLSIGPLRIRDSVRYEGAGIYCSGGGHE